MIIFEYTKNGAPVNDFGLDDYLKSIKRLHKFYDNPPMTIQHSTSNIFEMLMLYIAQGKLDHNSITFRFNGQDLKVTPLGDVDTWPKGFLLDHAQIYEDIMRARFERALNEKFNNDENS